jgi:hypothetical protein
VGLLHNIVIHLDMKIDGWREGFLEIVTNCWNKRSFHVHDIDKWQEKMRRLRRA